MSIEHVTRSKFDAQAAPFRRSGHPGLPPRLSVVVPCYNESENLLELHRRVTAVCQESIGTDYEIILINDGSRDRTWQIMRELIDRDPRVVAVNLSRNYGHQIALSAGLMTARGERILIIDADLQDPPELLPEMMAQIDAGADVAYGQRTTRAGETAFKKATASFFYRVLEYLVDVQIPRDTGDFRLITRRALDVLNAMPEQHRFIRGMVSWIGLRQTPIFYERAARFAGTTKYPLKKMIRFAVDAITGFSIQPLRLASYLGLGVGVSGLLLLIYTFAGWLSGKAVEGWTSLMVVFITLTSAQLFVLGIMGEYIGRIYVEVKRRPLFIIDEIAGTEWGPREADGQEPQRSLQGTEASLRP
jgi:dolichol-phosphate mannosyltransferase